MLAALTQAFLHEHFQERAGVRMQAIAFFALKLTCVLSMHLAENKP
jgi:hypothetical protein